MLNASSSSISDWQGASSGAGMGNAFLSQIRGVQVILHVVRCFSDQRVVHVEARFPWDFASFPPVFTCFHSIRLDFAALLTPPSPLKRLSEDPVNIDPVKEPGSP